LSERIKNLADQLANTTRVNQTLTNIRSALEDLKNRSEIAKAKAMQVIDEERQKIRALLADFEVGV
jgi:hypothetical protein